NIERRRWWRHRRDEQLLMVGRASGLRRNSYSSTNRRLQRRRTWGKRLPPARALPRGAELHKIYKKTSPAEPGGSKSGTCEARWLIEPSSAKSDRTTYSIEDRPENRCCNVRST